MEKIGKDKYNEGHLQMRSHWRESRARGKSWLCEDLSVPGGGGTVSQARWKEADAAEKVGGSRGGCGREPMEVRSWTWEGRAAGSHRKNSRS